MPKYTIDQLASSYLRQIRTQKPELLGAFSEMDNEEVVAHMFKTNPTVAAKVAPDIVGGFSGSFVASLQLLGQRMKPAPPGALQMLIGAAHDKRELGPGMPSYVPKKYGGDLLYQKPTDHPLWEWADKYRQIANESTKKAINSNPRLLAHQAWEGENAANMDIADFFNPRLIGSSIGNAAGFIGTQLVARGLGNKVMPGLGDALAFGLMVVAEGGMQYNEVYEDLIKRGYSKEDAIRLASASAMQTGFVNAYLENLRLNSVLKAVGLGKARGLQSTLFKNTSKYYNGTGRYISKLRKAKTFGDFAKTALVIPNQAIQEGAEEWLQGVNQRISELGFNNHTVGDILGASGQGVAEFAGGFWGGAGMSTFMAGIAGVSRYLTDESAANMFARMQEWAGRDATAKKEGFTKELRQAIAREQEEIVHDFAGNVDNVANWVEERHSLFDKEMEKKYGKADPSRYTEEDEAIHNEAQEEKKLFQEFLERAQFLNSNKAAEWGQATREDIQTEKTVATPANYIRNKMRPSTKRVVLIEDPKDPESAATLKWERKRQKAASGKSTAWQAADDIIDTLKEFGAKALNGLSIEEVSTVNALIRNRLSKISHGVKGWIDNLRKTSPNKYNAIAGYVASGKIDIKTIVEGAEMESKKQTSRIEIKDKRLAAEIFGDTTKRITNDFIRKNNMIDSEGRSLTPDNFLKEASSIERKQLNLEISKQFSGVEFTGDIEDYISNIMESLIGRAVMEKEAWNVDYIEAEKKAVKKVQKEIEEEVSAEHAKLKALISKNIDNLPKFLSNKTATELNKIIKIYGLGDEFVTNKKGNIILAKNGGKKKVIEKLIHLIGEPKAKETRIGEVKVFEGGSEVDFYQFNEVLAEKIKKALTKLYPKIKLTFTDDPIEAVEDVNVFNQTLKEYVFAERLFKRLRTNTRFLKSTIDKALDAIRKSGGISYKQLSEGEINYLEANNNYLTEAPDLKSFGLLKSHYRDNKIPIKNNIAIKGLKKFELNILNNVRTKILEENQSIKTISVQDFENEVKVYLQHKFLLGFAEEKAYLRYRVEQTFVNSEDILHRKISVRFNNRAITQRSHFPLSPSAWGNITYFKKHKGGAKDAALIHEIQNDFFEKLKQEKKSSIGSILKTVVHVKKYPGFFIKLPILGNDETFIREFKERLNESLNLQISLIEPITTGNILAIQGQTNESLNLQKRLRAKLSRLFIELKRIVEIYNSGELENIIEEQVEHSFSTSLENLKSINRSISVKLFPQAYDKEVGALRVFSPSQLEGVGTRKGYKSAKQHAILLKQKIIKTIQLEIDQLKAAQHRIFIAKMIVKNLMKYKSLTDSNILFVKESLKYDTLLLKDSLGSEYLDISKVRNDRSNIEYTYFNVIAHKLLQTIIEEKGRDFDIYFSGKEITQLSQGSQKTAMIYAGGEEISTGENLGTLFLQFRKIPGIKLEYVEHISGLIGEPGGYRVNIDDYNTKKPLLYQRDAVDRIIGQADIKAMTVLIDAKNQKLDTLPHEYAHHYIHYFKDSPLVKEAIKRFGSIEKLVQAVGEQAVRQAGEAYNWWKRFTNWILSKLSDKEVLQILTDSFLARKDLNKEFGFVEAKQEREQNRKDIIEAEGEIAEFSKMKGITIERAPAKPGYENRIGTIVLDESIQRRGMGTQIVNSFKKLMKAKGRDKIEIEASPGSEGFWEKQGFSFLIETREGYPIDPEENTSTKKPPTKFYGRWIMEHDLIASSQIPTEESLLKAKPRTEEEEQRMTKTIAANLESMLDKQLKRCL